MPFNTPLGERISNQANLTFIRPLVDKRATVSQSIKLECQVEGHPDPVIKWLKDGQNVSNCPDYEMSQQGNKHALHIRSAMNAAGIKQSTCLLIVAPAPTPLPGAAASMSIASSPVPPLTPVGPSAPFFIKELRNQLFKPGGSIVFEARVVGVPIPAIEFFKDGKPVDENYRYRTEFDPTSGIALLRFAQLFPEDLGEVTCRATNSIGTVECSAYILSKEDYENWLSNEKNSFYAEKKQRMIARSQQPQSAQLHRMTPQKQIQHRNLFESETEPELMHLHSSRAPIVPPTFRTEPRNLKLTEGTDAIIQCSIVGNPKPNVFLLKNHRMLDVNRQPRAQFTFKSSTAVLRILEVEPSDSAEYTIVAESSAGKAERSVRIEVFPLRYPESAPPVTQQKVRAAASQQTQREPPKSQIQQQSLRNFDYDRRPQQQATNYVQQSRLQSTVVQQRPQAALTQKQSPVQEQVIQTQRRQPEVLYTETYQVGRPIVSVKPASQLQQSSTQQVDLTSTHSFPQQQQPISQPVQRQSQPSNLRSTVDYHEYSQPVVRNQQLFYKPTTQEFQERHYDQPRPTVQHYYSPPQLVQQQQPVFRSYLDQFSGSQVVHQRHPDQRPSEALEEFLSGQATQYVHPYLRKPQQVEYELQQNQQMAPPIRKNPPTANGTAGGGGSPPQFVQAPQPIASKVGDKVTFTAQVSGQPTPTIEWKKGNKTLKSDSKYQITEKAPGQSQLVIAKIEEPDFGQYVAFAKNQSGTFGSQFEIVKPQIATKRKATEEPEERERVTLRRVDRSRQYQRPRPLEDEPPPSKEPPKFLSQLKDLTLYEGSHALMDVKFSPTDDKRLAITWLLNGRPIVSSSRITTIIEFGAAVLSLSTVTADDAGVYTVVAVNQLGEASQSANVEVIGHGSKSMASILDGQQNLSSRKTVVDRPNFHSELRSQELFEGQPLHLEAKITPISNVKVEFLHNGSPIKGDGVQFQNGFAVLRIESASVQNSGDYELVVSNEAGEARSLATIIIVPKIDLMEQSQIYDVEDAREIQFSEKAGQLTAPRILQPLRDFNCEDELGRSCFFARYEPVNNPSMRVKWLRDGQEIANANRIQMMDRNGYTSISIYPSYPDDAGVYTLSLINNLGSAESSANLTVVAPESLQLQSFHEDALQQINAIEGFEVHIGPLPVEREEEFNSLEAPRITRPLEGKVEVQQDEPVHFELRVLPDVKMVVEWTKDGQPLPAASRIRPLFDFGFCGLDILYTVPEDSGKYTVRAINELGEATSSIELLVHPHETLYLDPLHPESEGRIAELEQPKNFGIAEVPDRETDNPPQFLGDLQDLEVNEHDDITLELKLTPINDPTTVVQWYINDNPIYMASRYRYLYEFGLVQLRIKGVIPEDSGIVRVVATNSKGSDERSCTLNVLGKENIQTETQHELSLSKIEYLENLNKYAREEVVDFQPKAAPSFVQPLPSDLGELEEGQPLHLECQIEPINDNTLTIQWLHNGRPLPSAHRFRPFFDFAYVALDLLAVYAEDSGVLTCVARNQHGQAETSVKFTCQPKSRIFQDSLHPSSYAKIQELEAERPQAEDEPEAEKQAAYFIKPLQGAIEASEGDNIFIEAQVGPIDDNTLTYEWLLNGQPLAAGHRFVQSSTFGYIALSILYVWPEDSGTLSLRIQNSAGEASSSLDINVTAKDSLLTDTFHETAIERIAQLEAPRPIAEEAPEAEKSAPQIVKQLEVVPISDESVRLEAQYAPIDDNRLFSYWLLNGAPLKNSNRHSISQAFGTITLYINGLLPDDSGEYTLIIENDQGQVQTSATIDVENPESLVLDTNHPESLRRIIELESVKPAEPTLDDLPPEAPQFTQQLTALEAELIEGMPQHLDATVIPINDPSLQIEWYFNGQPLQFSNRIKQISEFGYNALELLYTRPEDSGTYTCRARNQAGEAESSVQFECKAQRNLYLESQHEESFKKIVELENRQVEKEPSPELVFAPPTFTQNLQNAEDLIEGDSVRLFCRVQPVTDPTLKLYWTCNNQPLPEANRFRISRNVDLNRLDIIFVVPEDAGVYSCVAKSDFGEAVTSANVKVQGTDALRLDTQHEASWQRVQELENRQPKELIIPEPEPIPPRFVRQFNQAIEVQEGQPVNFEAELERNDNNFTVTWLRDGQPLGASNRIRTVVELNRCAIFFLHPFSHDSATYSLVVTNPFGEIRCDSTLTVIPNDVLYLDPLHQASWNRIQELEAPKEKPQEAELAPPDAPQFIEPMESLQRIEGQPAHFQTRVTPNNDNKLTIQWLKDGTPLAYSNRMRIVNEFGLIYLNLLHCVASDAGTYTAVATNEQGEARVDAQLEVQPLDVLITDTQNPESWARVQQLEAPKEKPEEEQEAEQAAPRFVRDFQDVTGLVEGQPAHFEALIEPIDSNMIFQLYFNGRPIPITYWHTMLVKAINASGEAQTQAHLDCEKRPSLVVDPIHQASWNRIQELEAPKAPLPEPEEATYEAPQFTQPLVSQADVAENAMVRLAGYVYPADDPNLQLQWYKDDQPLGSSNRHTMSFDFGHVALLISKVTSLDNGVYSCKAVNKHGAAISNASLTVGDTENIIVDSAHPASYEKIQTLEGVDKFPRLEYPEQEFSKPVWVQTFENVDLEDEGAVIRLAGYVDPADDPDLRVEWTLNGVPLQNSNRHRCDFNFGSVVFTIVHVLPHDSGVYTCRAYNNHGEASTSCTVTVAGYEKILHDTLHQESWNRIQELEAPRIVEEVEMVEEKEKPRFLTQLEDATDIPEGQPIKLEATFQPARDNDLRVSWEFNGQPLQASQLVRTRSELGWACLEIGAVNPDHEGVYTIKIENTVGDAATSAKITCVGVGNVLGHTTHEESWAQIQVLEAPKEKEPTPTPVEYDAPTITTQIADVECDEGEPSVFEALFQPTNDPSLTVEWTINGQVANANKYVISQDFGLSRLSLRWTYPENEGVIQLRIANSKGEAVSSATLKCHPKDALLLDTTHPDSVAKIEELERPKEPAPEPEPAPLTPPKFTSPLQNVAELNEGQPVHFETTVEPLEGLKIEWLHNGAPIQNSNRFKIISDFGYCILNINGATVHDEGEWTVVATNDAGTDSVSSKLTIVASEGLQTGAINQQSLSRIEQIEAPRAPRQEPAPKEYAAPQITTQLNGPLELDEGDSCHLECSYTPTDDPSLTVQWLRDDNTEIANSNKQKVVFGFGIAALSSTYVLAHDAGTYTVVIKNAAGEATSSTTVQVNRKESLLLHPQNEKKAKAVQDLEDSLNRRPEQVEVAADERMPVFVEPLSAPVECQTGDRVHFSARYEPINSDVQLQWYLNNRPLASSSRCKTLDSLGFVVLEINGAIPEDSGQFTLKARNKNGEAVTSTSLTCTPTDSLLLDPQKAASWQRVQELEAPKAPAEEQPEIVHGPPKFITQLQKPPQLREGELLHLDAQLEPLDPTMVVEWLHNGQPVRDSNRHKKIYDFGMVVLELLPVEPQDNGTWVCRATNASGQAETSVEVEVVGDSGVSYEWVSPGERRERIDQLEEYINRPRDELVEPEIEFEAPHFTQELTDLGEFTETDAATFMCVLEPIGDPSMNVFWEHDGHPIPFSNRVVLGNNFGVCTLTVKHLIAQDSGTYVCRAVSDKGEATTTGHINVQTIIETETPQILQPLVENIDADEGESIRLDCRVSSANDPKLTVQWYKDGHPIGDSNRYKQTMEFGYVLLEILFSKSEDNGDWELRVVNDKGEASTKCHVVINTKPSLEFSAQAPGSTPENIEHHLRQFTRAQLALTEEDAYDPKVQRAPEFKTPLLNVGVEEGDYCRFETQVAPFSDPYLRVEWLKDGKLLPIGHRLRSTLEMGYCCLDLLYALPLDTGEYTCVATNKHGQTSVSAKLACSGKKDVLTETQIPQGLKVRDIKKKEENLYWIETAGQQERKKEGPQFTIKPRNVQVTEGQPARFECAVSGHPKPKVIWYVNGTQALHGHRYLLNYDGVHYLIIKQAKISDAGTIDCIAKNTEGEVIASASLDVFERNDFRKQKLRQAQLKSSDEMQARAQQWQVETLGQLGEDFKKAPKADATKLLKVERSRHPVEPLETEELVQKFTRPKNEQFYDKLNYVERQQREFENFELEPVSLKPGQVQRYQPEPETLEAVQLKNVQRSEEDKERFKSPPPEWATDSKLGETKGKFRQLDEPERELNIPARDQVKLRGAKPKPADGKTPVEHVQIEEDRAKLRAVQQGPEIEPEKIVPHKEQVSIRKKYQPKRAEPGEHVYVESGPLKDTPPVVKSEFEKTTISNKPQPTKMGQTQKAAPAIQTQLQPQQAEIGRSAVFVVKFTGDSPVIVKWFKDGRELRSAFDTQIKTTDGETRLELSKLKQNHQGDYSVRLSNAGGTCESSANLIITPATSKGVPPEFKQLVSDQRAQQGSTVKLTAQIVSKPQRPTITWFKDGKPLPNDARFTAADSDNETSLELTGVLPQDAGLVAVGPGGEARCKARLNVNLSKTGKGPEAGIELVAPRFNTPLKPLVVSEGQSTEFRANFTGDPEPMMRWYRNNEPIRPSRGYEVGHSNGECWMKIANVGQEHVAEYKVEASNPAGKASSVANLVLKPRAGRIDPVPAGAVGRLSGTGDVMSPTRTTRPVKIIEKLRAINGRAGENIKFVLQFDGDPVETTWTFNGKPLPDGKEYKTSLEQDKAILQISRVTPAHAGNYACTLKNASGTAKSETKLNVQSR
ncbi:hypothetical protein M3Y96_00652800 [Aphelenchoides besseyi]|nr:hypothetical protein M3Y96_00652800 [Aphelenchoides besseyi]